MYIFGGIIGLVIGFLLIKYSFQLTNSLGKFELAEKYTGGTYTFYKIAGVVIIILSFLYMFGGIGFVLGPLSSVFGGAKPPQ